MGKRMPIRNNNTIQTMVEDERTRNRSDDELLTQCIEHADERAFHALVSRYGPMVLSVCRCVLANESDAEDAFQATFLILSRKASSVRKRGSIGSWLHGVAYRTALKARKKNAARRKHEANAAERVVAAKEDLSWREAQCVLHEELSGLNERLRAVLVLCYLQNRTYDDAARLLAIAKSTLKKRLEQGREVLRARLIRRGLGPAAVLIATVWPFATATAATMPLTLATETAKAAALSAHGQAIAGLVSPQVASLAEAGLVGMFTSKTKVGLIALLVALTLGSTPFLGDFLAAQPPTKLHHDFRLGKPLPEWLKMSGPTKDATIDATDKGMRIGLPAERKQNLPVGVETKLVLAGDFEVTADFEVLSADRPMGGYGVGVSLNLARAADRKVFGKVARFWRAHEGSVFISEFWNHEPPPMPRALSSIPTDARIGRLRLVRTGDMLRYLAAEGLGNDFQEVYHERFSADDLTHLRFVVSDSGEPGNAVDARLLQLTIVGSKMTVAETPPPSPAPAAKAPPTPRAAPNVQAEEPPVLDNGSMLWLCSTIFVLVILAAIALILFRFLRRSTGKLVPSDPVLKAISFACSTCGKNLKTAPTAAGKRVKCPHCGQGMLAPVN